MPPVLNVDQYLLKGFHEKKISEGNFFLSDVFSRVLGIILLTKNF